MFQTGFAAGMWKTNLQSANAAAVSVPASKQSQRGGLAGLSLAMLLSSLGTSSASVALPVLTREFSTPANHAQWVVLAYLLAATALSVSAGRLGDVFGGRRLLMMGLALFTAASVLGGISASLGMLVGARVLQGAGAAMMMSLSAALVGENFPKEKTGRAMGVIGTMSAVGTALGPSLGGMLIAAAGWRAIFFVNAPLGLLAFGLIGFHLSSDHAQPRAQWSRSAMDFAGNFWLALTLAAYALAMTTGRGQFGMGHFVLLLAAAAGVVLFLRTEAAAHSPLVPPALFRSLPGLPGALTAGALVATVMMATLVVGPFYLSISLGLKAAAVGVVMTFGPGVAALAGVPAGRLVDRFGARWTVVTGLKGMTAGCMLLAILPGSAGIAGYVASIVLITASYALFQTANVTAVLKNVPAERRGLVSGMLNLARNFGLITGASVMGSVFTWAAAAAGAPATAGPDAIAQGLKATFAVASLLAIIALVVMSQQRHTEIGDKPGESRRTP
ncbi:MFS transporter [Prosthecobacter sp.]|uniref:MFS transporter n=1 Tax=Prosthecobacter sp. TaxID=1965333 RepID=UPI0037847ECB